MSRPLVIMVDDEAALRAVYQKFLSKRCDVEAFADGNAFLAALSGLFPSVFVLDWMLPDIDGIELCKRIRQDRRFDNVPIAFLTAMRPSLDNMQQVFDAGGQLFIEKTGAPASIISQIQTLVDAHERWRRTARLDATVMSFLRHDLMGYLTGAITGAEVMGLHAAFEDPDLNAQLNQVLSSGEAIRELVDDMRFVLRPGQLPPDSLGEQVTLAEMRTFVLRRLDVKTVAPDFSCPASAAMVPLLAGRLLYYLVLLLRYRYSGDIPLSIELDESIPEVPEAVVHFGRPVADELPSILYGPIVDTVWTHPDQALPIHFVATATSLMGNVLAIRNDGESCRIRVRLTATGGAA